MDRTKLFLCYFLCLVALFASTTRVQAQKKDKPFTVVLDAGHGGGDSGCIGNGFYEKNIALSVTLKTGQAIKKMHPDVRVLYTRETDKFIPLHKRPAFANRNNADLFISIHVNAVERNSKVNGTETFVLGDNMQEKDSRVNKANLEVVMRENEVILLEDNYEEKYQGFDPRSTESYIIFDMIKNKYLDQSISLATFIQEAYGKAGRPTSRGVKKGNLLVLRTSAMPSVLTEIGFINNKAEAQYMASSAGQNALAKSIASGFSKYLNQYRAQNGISTTGKPPKDVDLDAVSSASDKDTVKNPKSESKNTPCNYRIQIATTKNKVPLKHRDFKGHTVKEERMGVSYAYVTGCASTLKEARALQKKLSKDFKGAFIIEYKGGKRLKTIY